LHGSTETKEIEGISYPVGGDVILSVDGKPVRQIDDILIYLQRNKAIGDEIVLEILRDGRTTNFVLVLEERPNSN
jgi:S1-C subfamily serine protease